MCEIVRFLVASSEMEDAIDMQWKASVTELCFANTRKTWFSLKLKGDTITQNLLVEAEMDEGFALARERCCTLAVWLE